MLPPRLSVFDYLGGHRYFVTCCALGRRPILTDSAIVDVVRSQILQSGETYAIALLAYVFMPDHLHLLVEGRREDAAFRPFMRNWRKRSTLATEKCLAGRLWQKGYFDRVLRGEEGTEQVIEYMLDNPVRARLVKSAMDYPHAWSVATHSPLVGPSKPEGPYVP